MAVEELENFGIFVHFPIGILNRNPRPPVLNVFQNTFFSYRQFFCSTSPSTFKLKVIFVFVEIHIVVNVIVVVIGLAGKKYPGKNRKCSDMDSVLTADYFFDKECYNKYYDNLIWR